MSKILLIVSIVLVLGSAVLGFMTKGKIDGLQGDLTAERNTVTGLRSDLKKETAAKDGAIAAQTAAEEQAQQLETALNQSKDELAKANTDLEAAKADVTTKEERIAKLEGDIKSMTPPVPGGVGPTDDADPGLAMQNQLAEAQAQLAEAQQVSKSLESRLAEKEEEMADLREKAERRDRQVLAQGLSGQVLAVNRNWNFIVISVGDRQGAVVGGEMIVARNNSQVAKVRITAVEPTTSIADIIPGSMIRGASVQPGDTVIYPGARQ